MSVVCFGNFNGLHIGHKKIIESTIKLANDLFMESIVCMVLPSLYKTGKIDHETYKNIYKLNPTHIYTYVYDTPLKIMSDIDFIDKILYQELKAKHIFCGKDATYGFKKRGDVDLLIKQSQKYNFEVHVVDFVNDTQISNSKISTTNLVKFKKEGDIQSIRSLIDRNLVFYGSSIKGIGYCQKINMPTANIDVNSYMRNGVYVGYIKNITKNIEGKSLIYIDNNKIESHIFNEAENGFITNMWGDYFKVEIYEFLREKISFENYSENDIKSIIIQDKKNAIESHEKYSIFTKN